MTVYYYVYTINILKQLRKQTLLQSHPAKTINKNKDNELNPVDTSAFEEGYAGLPDCVSARR
jgi:hypothetical protein